MRAHDEYFGHNRRIVGTSMGATGQSRRDAPRPSPESAVRPGNTTPDWRRSGRKAELAVRRELRARVCCVRAAQSPLTVSRNVLCSRPTRCRPTTPADRTQCDAHIMPRVRRRIPKSAVCAVLPACRCIACTARRLKEERVDDAGGRTSATAASYAASLL